MIVAIGRVTVFTVVLCTFCSGLLLIALWSIDDAIKHEPALSVSIFDVSQPSAKSFIVFDQETGTEIASKNSTEVLPIASVTKLLVAAVFEKEASLSSTTTILWSDVNTEGDAGKLHAYEEYTYRELLFPLLLESSNDAAVAMQRIHPSLLSSMNAYVASHSLLSISFSDTSGLSEENVSSAYDLFVLARSLYTESPHIFDITRLSQFIGTHTGWINNNPLQGMEGYRGGKHGFTYASDRTAVAFFEETLNDDQKRIIGYVLLGSTNLASDIEILRAEVRQNVRFE